VRSQHLNSHLSCDIISANKQYHSWYGYEGFVLKVGEGRTSNSYFLHRGYACYSSRFFDDLYKDVKKAIINVDFASEPPDVIYSFAHWLYPKWLQMLADQNQNIKDLEAVNRLLVFAEKYWILDLAADCYKKIRMLLAHHAGGLVTAERVKALYDAFGPTSSMMRSFYLRMLVQRFSSQESQGDVQFLESCFEGEPEFAKEFFGELRSHIKFRRAHPYHDRDLEIYMLPPLVPWWGEFMGKEESLEPRPETIMQNGSPNAGFVNERGLDIEQTHAEEKKDKTGENGNNTAEISARGSSHEQLNGHSTADSEQERHKTDEDGLILIRVTWPPWQPGKTEQDVTRNIESYQKHDMPHLERSDATTNSELQAMPKASSTPAGGVPAQTRRTSAQSTAPTSAPKTIPAAPLSTISASTLAPTSTSVTAPISAATPTSRTAPTQQPAPMQQPAPSKIVALKLNATPASTANSSSALARTPLTALTSLTGGPTPRSEPLQRTGYSLASEPTPARKGRPPKRPRVSSPTNQIHMGRSSQPKDGTTQKTGESGGDSASPEAQEFQGYGTRQARTGKRRRWAS
jgi:hypothetical protein